jgi:RNA polymerase sigma-70 factor (ECF subfamily)
MTDFADLMRKTLQGDKPAYSSLLRETAKILRPYIAKRIFQKQDAEDVLQEILIAIHKVKHTYDGNRAYLPWAYAIANYKIQDRLRKLYSDPLRNSAELIIAENNSEENVTKSGLAYEDIAKEVEKLPQKQAKILRLIHKDGYTAKEVAAQIGMTESAVKVAAHRAYKVLRKKLGG